MRKLYVESEWSAEDVGAQLDSKVHIVLRTGQAHGVPIRRGGRRRPAVTMTVAVIESLYRDEQFGEVLDRHGVPRRPAAGDIAVRFPEPVALTAPLLAELYDGAGCSSSQVELAHQAIPGRGRRYYASARVRATPGTHVACAPSTTGRSRARLLAQVAAEYRACGSIAEVARLHNCANTVIRWLAQAGVTVAGRGQWSRR